jgi:DtxR family Mn-dependent transcriptional regulator
MYLKTISTLGEETSGAVHVQDIAARLGVRMPSVTQALHRLAEQNYVAHTRYGTVTLTPRGARAARDVRDRHRILEEFLTRVLHVPPTVAAQDACAMEHVVSPLTLQRLTEFLDFLRTCPIGAADAVAHFADFSRARSTGSACPECALPDPGAHEPARSFAHRQTGVTHAVSPETRARRPVSSRPSTRSR